MREIPKDTSRLPEWVNKAGTHPMARLGEEIKGKCRYLWLLHANEHTGTEYQVYPPIGLVAVA